MHPEPAAGLRVSAVLQIQLDVSTNFSQCPRVICAKLLSKNGQFKASGASSQLDNINLNKIFN